MSTFGDYPDEMPFDEFSDGVQSFAKGLKAAATHVPTPSCPLAELLATGGVSVDQPKPRSVFMKIKTYVAGLGMATKVVLGAGVAAAATTGAGAAGVLPAPVQNAVGDVVATVIPFAFPKANDGHHEAITTEGDRHDDAVVPTPTTEPSHHEDGRDSTTTSAPAHDEERPVVTPTTVRHDEPRRTEEERPTTSTTQTPRHEEEHPTTTTTVAPGHGDGDNNNPQSITLNCYSSPEPNRISCRWTASSNPDHRRYALLRTSNNSSQGRVVFQSEAGLEYSDTSVEPGVTYTYRVVSLREDGSTESHSNAVTFLCCAFSTTSL